MANPEHLKILNQGVEVWNQWRKDNPEIQPDLSNTELSWINLTWANFSKTDLSKAILNRANLSEMNLNRARLIGAQLIGARLVRTDAYGANFSEANLNMADLSEANLGGTNFTGANLSESNLSMANLSFAKLTNVDLSRKANLQFVNFSDADLSNVDFNRAKIGMTIFGNNDLSSIKGLDTVRHSGPSTIGLDTLYRSGGNIPYVFLRGCGVPDEFISYMRSLVTNPIQFYSCFISYSSKNQVFAERLYADLQNKGVRCWFAPEDLKIGDRIRDRIDESIKLRDKLLLILSEHSIASDWVEHEVESALEEEKQRGRTILFPIRLDDAVMDSSKAWTALIRRTRHIGDFREWKNHDSYQKAFDRLLRDLKAEDKTASS